MRGIFPGFYLEEERLCDNEATTIVINDNTYDAVLTVDRMVTRTWEIVYQVQIIADKLNQPIKVEEPVSPHQRDGVAYGPDKDQAIAEAKKDLISTW